MPKIPLSPPGFCYEDNIKLILGETCGGEKCIYITESPNCVEKMKFGMRAKTRLQREQTIMRRRNGYVKRERNLLAFLTAAEGNRV